MSVVELKPRKETLAYECECGCQWFRMLETMEIECRGCKGIATDIFLTTEEPSKEHTAEMIELIIK